MLSGFAKDTSRPGRKRKPLDKASLVIARQLVDQAYHVLRNWDAVASYYGISKAAANRIANDLSYRPSQAVVDRIRDKPLPVPPLVPVPPCPIHGVPHVAGPCSHDGPVAAVVVLAPGETVKRQRPPRQYSRIADMPVSILARAIRKRVDV